MSLPTLPKVQKLQAALHAKAKGSPAFRFYALYDKVYRDDVLWVAYRRCLVNGGAAGIDGQTFEDIERYGVQKWLGELAEELRESFDFLGYTIGRCYSPKTGRAFLGTRPSRKRVNRLCQEISAMTSGSWSKDVAEQVAALNRKLQGWSNYFCLGQVSPAYGAVDYHVVRRLRATRPSWSWTRVSCAGRSSRTTATLWRRSACY